MSLSPTTSPSASPTIDDGVRIVVYECDVGPAYCSQFDPADGLGLGWKAVGHCRGTRVPSMAPTQYGGTCTYEKCVGTASPTTSPSSSPSKVPTGSPSGSPTGDDLERRNLKVCTTEDVLNYSPTTDYEPGDVVRIGTKRYKCKDSPNGLWCKISAYAPSLKPGIWSDAWIEDGTCPPPSGLS